MMDLFGAEDVHIQNKQKQPCMTTEIEKIRKQRARTYQKAKNREISKQTISKLQLHNHLAPSGGQWQRPQGGARCLTFRLHVEIRSAHFYIHVLIKYIFQH